MSYFCNFWSLKIHLYISFWVSEKHSVTPEVVWPQKSPGSLRGARGASWGASVCQYSGWGWEQPRRAAREARSRARWLACRLGLRPALHGRVRPWPIPLAPGFSCRRTLHMEWVTEQLRLTILKFCQRKKNRAFVSTSSFKDDNGRGNADRSMRSSGIQ